MAQENNTKKTTDYTILEPFNKNAWGESSVVDPNNQWIKDIDPYELAKRYGVRNPNFKVIVHNNGEIIPMNNDRPADFISPAQKKRGDAYLNNIRNQYMAQQSQVNPQIASKKQGGTINYLNLYE